jgi:hypothetical protein
MPNNTEVLNTECISVWKTAINNKPAKLEEENDEEEGSRKLKYEENETAVPEYTQQCTQLSPVLHLACLG